MKKIMILAVAVAVTVTFVGCKSTNASKVSSPLKVHMKTAILTPEVEVIGRTSGASSVKSIGFGPMKITWGASKLADGVLYNSGASSSNNMLSQVATMVGKNTKAPAYQDLVGPKDVANAKAAATYDALQQSQGADFILSPNYQYDITNYIIFQRIDCKVDGFAGKLKGFDKNIEYKILEEDKTKNYNSNCCKNK